MLVALWLEVQILDPVDHFLSHIRFAEQLSHMLRGPMRIWDLGSIRSGMGVGIYSGQMKAT